MRRTLVTLLATSSAFLSIPALADTPAVAPTQPAAASDPVPMQFPGWGFNPADLDRARKPGDDFNAYVNGKWEAVTEIPPQYPYYGTAVNLTLGAAKNVRAIIEAQAAKNAPLGSTEQRVGDGYKAFTDTAAIDANGMAPAQPWLNRIAAIKDMNGLVDAFAVPGIPAPIGGGVSIDLMAPNSNALYLGLAGTGLPDRDYYLVDSPRNLDIRAKYKDYLAFLLGKAGYANPAASAAAVYEVERKIAANDWDRATARDPHLIYNKVTRAELVAMAGSFPVQRWLDGEGIGAQQTFIVAQLPPSAAKAQELGLSAVQLAKLGGGMPAQFALINATPIDTWKAWATTRFLISAAAVLPSDVDAANFGFYGKFLQGSQRQRERWQRGVGAVQGLMGEAIGKLYVQQHFPESSKMAMQALVANIRSAMRSEVGELTWMSPATRDAARAKLDAFRVKIGYPDKFETYDGLAISPSNPIANSVAASDWQWHKQLRELAAPVDKAKWQMTPQTVNAYYSPPGNEIVFPAAYLQPPFFNPAADDAVNYGAVGSTIGHEISHGFDDQGSKYDGTGTLRNWWTPADKVTFNALGTRLAAQYDAFCPFDAGKTCLNGKLTLGENMADLSGLSLAYRAYHISLKGRPAPVLNGLSGDQRFFISYAQSHRSKWREAFERQIIQTDPHSPDDARVNVVLRNFDPWYKAFNVKPGDKLYLAPTERVHIW